MIPGKYNPRFVQGDTWEFSVNVQDANETAFDLTGYTAQSQLREHASSVSAAITLTCEIETPTNGIIKVTGDKDSTSAVTAGKYAWDLQITYVSGEIYTILAGTFTVLAEVTREGT